MHDAFLGLSSGTSDQTRGSTCVFGSHLLTFLDFNPAVGARSLGSDSGMGSLGSSKWIPGHPTHKPLPLITTGATAVTKPPALQVSNYFKYAL